jgi:hypothetical protein
MLSLKIYLSALPRRMRQHVSAKQTTVFPPEDGGFKFLRSARNDPCPLPTRSLPYRPQAQEPRSSVGCWQPGLGGGSWPPCIPLKGPGTGRSCVRPSSPSAGKNTFFYYYIAILAQLTVTEGSSTFSQCGSDIRAFRHC